MNNNVLNLCIYCKTEKPSETSTFYIAAITSRKAKISRDPDGHRSVAGRTGLSDHV